MREYDWKYDTHVILVMLRLYLSLSPGLLSSGCFQVTVTLVSLSAVTLTSSGGLGMIMLIILDSLCVHWTYFGIVWTPSETQARMGAVYRAQEVTSEAVMLSEV